MSTMLPITVLIAEDHALLADALELGYEATVKAYLAVIAGGR